MDRRDFVKGVTVALGSALHLKASDSRNIHSDKPFLVSTGFSDLDHAIGGGLKSRAIHRVVSEVTYDLKYDRRLTVNQDRLDKEADIKLLKSIEFNEIVLIEDLTQYRSLESFKNITYFASKLSFEANQKNAVVIWHNVSHVHRFTVGLNVFCTTIVDIFMKDTYLLLKSC